MTDTQINIAVAAIIHDRKHPTDQMVLDFANRLKQEGLRVFGVVQAPRSYSTTGVRQMGIINVSDGSRIKISQDRGSGSRGCSVDAGALADASQILLQACADGADLVIVNRFGTLESEGDGFAEDILALIAANIPVLTVVEEKHLEGWRHFTGGLGSELQPDNDVLNSWFYSLPQNSAAGCKE